MAMPAPALDDLMAVNDQLVALDEAGVPVETGLGAGRAGLVARLQDVNVAVARRVGHGAALDEALSEVDGAAPPLYASLLRVAARRGDLTAALRASTRLAEWRDRSRDAAAFSLIYPTIVFLMAYVGLVLFCLVLVPVLLNLQQSMGIQPRLGLKTLAALRESLPLWVALPPLGLVLALAAIRQRAGRPARGGKWALSRLPGMAGADYENRAANFSQSMAALLESGLSLDEALAVAAPALGLAAASGSVSTTAMAARQELPPFLRWALFESDGSIDRQAALAAAADIYRAKARQRLARWQTVAPIVLCIVVGGGITLLYGLALFVPIVDMLRGLAS
jgi:type II secretory pathway component PulF